VAEKEIDPWRRRKYRYIARSEIILFPLLRIGEDMKKKENNKNQSKRLTCF
jgi:hypothetical protein